MLAYVETTECRRKFILSHFNDQETASVAPCGRCDRCTLDLDLPWGDVATAEVPDITKDPGAERVLLDAIIWANGRLPKGQLCRMLAGQARQIHSGGERRDLPNWLIGSEYFGKLGHIRLTQLNGMVDALVNDKCVEREERVAPNGGYSYFVLRITERGRRRRDGVIQWSPQATAGDDVAVVGDT